MTDIYGNTTTYSGNAIIKAQDMQLKVSSTGVTGETALVQNVVIQYAQPIQVIREVGSRNYYYYAQLPQGTVSFGRLTSVDKKILDMLPKSSGIWEVPKDDSTKSPDITLSGGNLQYTMHQCIVESLGISTEVNGAFVQEQVSIRFGSMEISTISTGE